MAGASELPERDPNGMKEVADNTESRSGKWAEAKFAHLLGACGYQGGDTYPS